MSKMDSSSNGCPMCYILTAGGVVLAMGLLWKLCSKKLLGACCAKKPPMDANEYHKFPLIEKTVLTEGVTFPVVKFRFGLPHPEDTLPLPIGQHVSLRCINPENGKVAMRSYTPTSSADDKGYFDLVVKIYPKGVMGQFLNHLEVGKGFVEARGPKGRFTYEPNKYSTVCMLAGGSGITPMYQIMTAIAKHSATDNTKVSLIYGNVSEKDIILHSEIDGLANGHSGQISIYHVLNEAPKSGMVAGVGFVTEAMIRERFPAPSTPNVIVLLCGPPPMINAMMGHLEKIGYNKETQVFCF